MAQLTPFRAPCMSDDEYERLCEAVITAARQMSPAQVADLADGLYDIRRTKRRRVDLHGMLDELT